MRRFAASLVLALTALAAPGIAGTALGVEIEGGACSLVTERELREHFGGRRWPEQQGGPDDPLRCGRHNDQLGRRSKAVLVKFTPATQEQSDSFRRDFISSAPGSELEVAGFPAVQDGGTLHVFVGPQGWLSVETTSESRRDHGRLPEVAAIAVGRLDPSIFGAGDTTTEPTGDLCAILDLAAVSTAIGEPVSIISTSADACTLAGDLAAGSTTNLAVQLATGDPLAVMPLIEEVRAAFPDAVEIEVGGVPAIQPATEPAGEGVVSAQLVIFPDEASALILVAAAPDTVDLATALVTIGEQVLAGLAAPPAA